MEEARAFPISPPSPAKVRDTVPECGDDWEQDALEALADDVPGRLRETLVQAYDTVLGKRAAPCNDDAGTVDQQVIPETSDAFGTQPDDAWDLDDAELYSGEQVVLTSDLRSSSPQPTERVAHTPVTLLREYMDSLFGEEDGSSDASASFHRIDGEMILRSKPLQRLQGLLHRIGRDPGAQDVLEIDPFKLSRLLHMLERAMRRKPSKSLFDEAHESVPYEAVEQSIIASLSALWAAQCALIILAQEQLPKFLFSEELLEQCIAAVKMPLESFVLPLIEASVAQHMEPKTVLDRLAFELMGDSVPERLRELLAVHFHNVNAAMLFLERLFRLPSVTIPEPLLIPAVYLSLAPFFVQECERHGSTLFAQAHVLRPMRLSSLIILRSIFSLYPQQRIWVLGELLVSLLRLPDMRLKRREFRLSNGRAVYTISALLLQLLQAAAYESRSSQEQTLAWMAQCAALDTDPAPPMPATRTDQENVYALASTIAMYLCNEASQAKLVKNSSELSYASIIYFLMEDLLTLLFLPDWPAAPLLLTCFCRIFVASLKDAKSSLDAKAIALDHVGVVAARLKQAERECWHASRKIRLASMAELCASLDNEALTALERAYHSVAHCIMHSSTDQPAAAAASQYLLHQFGHDLAQGMSHIKQQDIASQALVLSPTFSLALVAAYERLLYPAHAHDKAHAFLVPQLVFKSSYFITTPELLSALLPNIQAQALGTRTRALRGVGNICAVDHQLLNDVHVRNAVLAHSADTSANVREIAIAILGAYVLQHAEGFEKYHSLVAHRISDTAVAVRKRAMRYLQRAFVQCKEYSVRVDALLRILRCIHDVDPGMQALASEVLEALFFSDTPECDAFVDAQMLVSVGAQTRERPSPLDAFFRGVSRERSASEKHRLMERLGALVEALICDMFENATSEAILDRIRVVHTMLRVYPQLLSISRAKQLLPYLYGCETGEDIGLFEELLRVYCIALPSMPRTAIAFAQHLERTLTARISRCSLLPGSTALQELVACFCATIRFQTHHYALLERTFATCFTHVQEALPSALEATRVDRNVYLLMCMACLLCEHGWKASSEKDHAHRVFACILQLLDSKAYQLPAMTALGYLLRAYPSFFLHARVTKTMDSIMASGDADERQLVLRILLDYLNAEAAQSVAPVPVHVQQDMMGELTGSGEAYTGTGVASALIHRYASPVLNATLDVDNRGVQRLASEILALAVLQGLAHPIQCMPYIIALETSSDISLRNRAVQLHVHLVSKHGSLLATRYKEGALMSYTFQRTVLGGAVRGFRSESEPTALLQTWYALLREQRGARHAFLKALVRLLDPGDDVASSDVDLALYIADNLATLEYKFQNEVLALAHELKLTLAAMRMHVFGAVQRYLRLREPSPLTDEESDEEHAPANADLFAHVRAVQILHIGQALRAHLKRLYKLSEAYVFAQTLTTGNV
ncbi:Sister chromatid cohesion protein 2 [Malassezia vespertilionis]|uniref:Sister chromatid cohesion protein 2 n=1 Tax=Malassezia vespertilionis TaxID=2020962 RepID=UPI0024B18130|nr:Sister chromatid cohesion protein 2 [Malassezia vespertilionis]WFD06511.1 Sister chromatid cohesion protein 2 [Malassezia vespertilionis]